MPTLCINSINYNLLLNKASLQHHLAPSKTQHQNNIALTDADYCMDGNLLTCHL